MHRRGFTLLELLVAGVMASVVLGGVTMSLSQLGLSKSISRQRLDAYSRCDTALRTIRRDIISVLRRDDLFDTRLKITDDAGRFDGREVDRDEILLFNHSLRANKEIDFNTPFARKISFNNSLATVLNEGKTKKVFTNLLQTKNLNNVKFNNVIQL